MKPPNKPRLLAALIVALLPLALSAAPVSAFFSLDRHGPIYNGTSCAQCHRLPELGGSTLITVAREGRSEGGGYVPGPNGGLRHSTPKIVSSEFSPADITGLRVTLNMLGDGYIEAIPDDAIRAIAESQPRGTNGAIRGQTVEAAVLEAPGKTAVGRFGWKSQHASLLSSSADALRNELGITNSLYAQALVPEPGTEPVKMSEGSQISAAAGDAELDDILRFLRSTEPIAPDQRAAASPADRHGAELFEKIGCGICHVSTFTTAPAGTLIDGGTYLVPERLGGKTIHPYSDFLLHDIGTGDGIVQTAVAGAADANAEIQATANKFRTPPLWGMRMKTWLMHDGQTRDSRQAIQLHAGEASAVTNKYLDLSPVEQSDLISFLDSL